MVRRTRAEMAATRASLIATARQVFAESGYADASMDELTARAGLTRGALYHHFGDKQGLLAAVVAQIDAEIDDRLQAISDAAADNWQGFRSRCRAYLEMALEPEYQRLVLRDARAVLGGATLESQRLCVASMAQLLDVLIKEGQVERAEPQAIAALVYGSLAEAAFWIADSGATEARLQQALAALDLLLRGLLRQRE